MTSLAKTTRCLLLLALASTAACVPMLSRFKYLSFEGTPGVEVEKRAPVDVEGSLSRSTIPVRYRVVREHYTIRIQIDPRDKSPNATIVLENSPGFRMETRPWRGARPDHPTICGSYDEESQIGEHFKFWWVICGNAANPPERVVAFDVIGEDGAVTEENLPFTLKEDGLYWYRDTL